MTVRRRIRIDGIVQGVGFRPFVHQLAQRHELAGSVRNSSFGVWVEVEGSLPNVSSFLQALPNELPRAAQIDEMTVEDVPPRGDTTFEILPSLDSAESFVLVPPDLAICAECAAELIDPKDRRYGYPFLNCTHCGPRYTIIEDVPYDRPLTTMREFCMCPDCRREYQDTADRRFHAQPIACPVCGPQVTLWDREQVLARGAEAIQQVREALRRGRIVALKGLGGFHLACDATSASAVRTLRDRKHRIGKPFAVMVAHADVAARLAWVSEAERKALESVRSPIVILQKRDGAPVAEQVAPGNRTLGVMLPYTPLHQLLFAAGSLEVLVMTSGNVSEEPIAARDYEVAPRLHALADRFLLHNRRIQTRVDDSVVRVVLGRERVLRRARGFAPHPVDLGVELKPLLATGADLKNTFCLTRRHYAILSQHIGDLENLETLEVFQETLEHMKRFFRVEPRAVAHDLHPAYFSTRIAQQQGLPLIGVQHHHAHIASCMAEHRLDRRVVGVALDGTGYGTDGKIWGGEVLLCDRADFERRGHFGYIPLAGGDSAVRQPWRAALGYLWAAHGRQAFSLDLPLFREVPETSLRVVAQMIERGIQTVETSSCGRLFDAAASLTGVCHENSYEAQAAIEFESRAAGDAGEYPFFIDRSTDPWQIDFRETMRALVRDRSGAEIQSARFHAAVAAAVAECASAVARAEGIEDVCLSGGSMQNVRLATDLVARLSRNGLTVHLQARVPSNDGGISLGQAVVGNARLRDA